MSALVIGGGFLLQNARVAIASEIRSSMLLAQQLIGVLLEAQRPAPLDLADVQSTLDQLRHVRVTLVRNYSTAAATIAESAAALGEVPSWFAGGLLVPLIATEQLLIPLGEQYGVIVISADPRDELAEIWRDVRVMAWAVAGAAGAIVALFYAALALGLHPLQRLLTAFDGLQNGLLDSRVNERAVPELAEIHRKFNHVAGVLQHMVEDNRHLAGTLLHVQEDERKALARELHDEVAPYLFSIRVAVSSAVAQAPAAPVTESLSEIDHNVIRLQSLVKRLLTRLRPPAIDELGFADSIRDLIDGWRRRLPDVAWELHIDELPRGLDDTLTSNLYRIIQESVTNIARHAEPRMAKISITAQGEPITRPFDLDKQRAGSIRIVVEDDGRGITADQRSGFGLLGMRERVDALGGRFEIFALPRGTRVSIDLPC